jgi:hypothetical protein
MKWDGRLACCDYPVLRPRVGALVVRSPTQLVRVGGVRMRVSKARGVVMMRIAIVRMAERRLNECPDEARSDPRVKNLLQSSSIVIARIEFAHQNSDRHQGRRESRTALNEYSRS